MISRQAVAYYNDDGTLLKVIPIDDDINGDGKTGAPVVMVGGKPSRDVTSGDKKIKSETPSDDAISKIDDDLILAKKLKSILKDNSYNRYRDGYKSGRLGDNLYKVITGGKNVFTRKADIKDKNYNVVLLLDCSGSMRDPTRERKARYVMAVEVVERLIKAFNKCDVEFSLVGFNERIITYKEFNKPIKSLNLINDVHENIIENGCDNNDAGAVYYARKLLKNRRGKNIIITISDGLPIGTDRDDYYADVCAELKTDATARPSTIISGELLIGQVNKATREGISVCAVGIDTDAVTRYYKNYAVIHSASELKTALIGMLQKDIKRGS